jgi:hypothetical protein
MIKYGMFKKMWYDIRSNLQNSEVIEMDKKYYLNLTAPTGPSLSFLSRES